MNKLKKIRAAKTIRAAKGAKGGKTVDGKQKKRVFGRKVIFERAVIKFAKHGPEPKTRLEMSRSRRAMEAHLMDEMRLSKGAVSTAMDVTMMLIDEVCARAALLLEFADKRTVDERTLKLAINDVLSHYGYFGRDIATMAEFIYRGLLPVYVESKGRQTAARLVQAFDVTV